MEVICSFPNSAIYNYTNTPNQMTKIPSNPIFDIDYDKASAFLPNKATPLPSFLPTTPCQTSKNTPNLKETSSLSWQKHHQQILSKLVLKCSQPNL
jgi:hypothetical protein